MFRDRLGAALNWMLPRRAGGQRGILRLIARWVAGSVAGTALIAATSPAFVRSYVPWRVDPVRGTWTLPPAAEYRWRSEGYATTRIGPLGMPGKTSLGPPPGDAPAEPIRVALWGDSQAEGVVVADEQKLFAQAERIAAVAGAPMIVYPLARSGEDAAVWLSQMPAVERALAIDVHVMLIVDLPDLYAAADAPLAPVSEHERSGLRAALAAHLPAFLIHAARGVLTEADGNAPRTLRFSLGPVEQPEPPPQQQAVAETPPDWPQVMRAITTIAERPVIVLHAPPAPQIVGGRVATEGPWAEQVPGMRRAAEAHGVTVASAHEALLASAAQGDWPHGFHNGRVGNGHLNAAGYRLVARELVRAVVGQAASLSSARSATLAASSTGDGPAACATALID